MTHIVSVEHAPPRNIVPGTIYIIDQTVRGTGHANHETLLIPVPSDRVEDPLRWHPLRKNYHLFLLVYVVVPWAYSTILGAVTQWTTTIYVVLARYYRTTIADLSIGLAICLLMLGVANVVLIPISNKLGRRAVYLWTLLLVFGAEVWLAKSKTISDFQGAHALLGIGAAPFEALVPISISDVFFAHERGAKVALYVFGLALGSLVGPICSGYIATGQGWQWIYWWGTILIAGLFVVFYFTFEETRFERPHARENGVSNDGAVLGRKVADAENRCRTFEQTANAPKVGDRLESSRFQVQFKPYQQFQTSWLMVLKETWQPFKVCWFPAVIWCGINYGTCVSWLAVMGTTVASTFAAPPYLFSNEQIGLFWIAPLVGSIVGTVYAGILNDHFVLFLSRRNNGYREPEFRLWAMLPSALIMPAGLMLYGIAAAQGLPWIVPFLGGGLVGFGLTVGGALSIGYIIDCYKKIDTQVVTTIILIRNVVGFAITWAIQPWITNMGKQNAFIVVGVLGFTITALAALFIARGKSMRRWTAEKYAQLASS